MFVSVICCPTSLFSFSRVFFPRSWLDLIQTHKLVMFLILFCREVFFFSFLFFWWREIILLSRTAKRHFRRPARLAEGRLIVTGHIIIIVYTWASLGFHTNLMWSCVLTPPPTSLRITTTVPFWPCLLIHTIMYFTMFKLCSVSMREEEEGRRGCQRNQGGGEGGVLERGKKNCDGNFKGWAIWPTRSMTSWRAERWWRRETHHVGVTQGCNVELTGSKTCRRQEHVREMKINPKRRQSSCCRAPPLSRYDCHFIPGSGCSPLVFAFI